MRKGLIYQYFQKIQQEIYDFSYCLLPDYLQAGQMVMDSIYVFLVNEVDWKGDDLILSNEDLFISNMKKFLFGHVFILGCKRGEQLYGSFDNDLDFYKLDIIERAVIYLVHTEKMSLDEVENILNFKRGEGISYLTLARSKVRGREQEWEQRGFV